MATDRLVTLAGARDGRWIADHDQVANKLIVLITVDAAVLIGYCGSAYIGGVPTDNWIADVASPGADFLTRPGGIGSFGFKAMSKLRLHQVLNRIRIGLAEYPEGAGVTVLVVGWRCRRRLVTPINVIIRAASQLGSSADIQLRPVWPARARMQSIGAVLSLTDYREALAAHGDMYPWMGSNVVGYFTSLIRRRAQRDRTVGSNVMSAVLRVDQRRGIRLAECCFDPEQAHYGELQINGQTSHQMVFYNPWFLSPHGYYAPTQSTGEPGSGASFEMDDWTFEMNDVPRAPGTPSNVGWEVPQPRAPMPRRR